MKFHRCPKCGGQLYQDSDRFGNFQSCIQCGYEGQTHIMPQIDLSILDNKKIVDKMLVDLDKEDTLSRVHNHSIR